MGLVRVVKFVQCCASNVVQAGNHGLATRSSVDCNGEGVAGLGPLSREGEGAL